MGTDQNAMKIFTHTQNAFIRHRMRWEDENIYIDFNKYTIRGEWGDVDIQLKPSTEIDGVNRIALWRTL